jgi:hypothetical protein
MYIQPTEKTTAKTATAAFYAQEIKKAICPSIQNGRARTGKQTGGPG